jgi:hypothetical protein
MVVTKRRMVRNAGRAIRKEIVLVVFISFFSGMAVNKPTF